MHFGVQHPLAEGRKLDLSNSSCCTGGPCRIPGEPTEDRGSGAAPEERDWADLADLAKDHMGNKSYCSHGRQASSQGLTPLSSERVRRGTPQLHLFGFLCCQSVPAGELCGAC